MTDNEPRWLREAGGAVDRVQVYETDLVLSADGHALGRVGALRGDAVQVTTTHGADLWVAYDAVARRDDQAQAIYLRCTRDALDACRAGGQGSGARGQ